MSLGHPFSNYEMLVLFEVAQTALADADIFDDMAEKLDIADAEMVKIQEKLSTFLEER